MKLPSLFVRPIAHLRSKTSKFLSPNFSSFSSLQDFSVSNEIHSILDIVNPMEPALEPLLPFLSPDIVTSIIQDQPNPQLGFRFFIWAMQSKRLRSSASDKLVVDMLLRKDNGFDMYWQTLEEIKKCGALIVSDAFKVLISGYSKLGLDEKAVECFGKMKDFDCKPDVFTYNTILYVMVRRKVLLLALAVYNQMLKNNYKANRATFSILIDGLCKNGKTEDALNMFDEMTQRGIEPNRCSYTIIVSGLCQADRADDACRLLNKMKESGCSPDFVAYNALLNGFCQLGRVDEAFALLQSFQKDGFVLGLRGYSSFINGLFRARRFEEAYAWYTKMFEENVKPDVVLYAIMLRGLSVAGKVEDAMKLLSEMTERGLVPDTYCYNAVIKGFCDTGLLDQARSLQLEISSYDCFPNACTYTILISGMCQNGLVGEAQQIFDEMEKLGCFPSVVTFNALIDGLSKAGQLEKAHLLFYKMEIGRNPSLFLRLSHGSSGVLDSSSLQTMVEQLYESGRILKAYRILMQLADGGNVPDIFTYNILIHGFCKAGNINGAFKLFKELQLKGISPDSVTYGTLINGFQMAGREEDAFRIFDQMVKNGCKPSVAVYRSLMTWSCRRRKVSLAFNLWLMYLRSLPGRQDTVIKEVEKYFDEGQVEKAVRGLLKMDFKLNSFSVAPYTIWLIGLCQAGRVEEALKIFYILEECKVVVSPPSCVRLIVGLCKEGNLDLAVDVFLYTLEQGFKLMPRICNHLLKSLLRSKDKRMHAFGLLSKMNSQRYDLDAYLHKTTKSLLYRHWHTWKMENVAPG
ncbi:PREDICTED: pentatricopeptide repeat-containing protein At1g79540 [Theobroma cacao]|uniref:Pentatricopeptide repeat-containing protein At1g79540 n=1 Tax=Theobroma cacao TaxID=3641 RepID=A0AB32WWN0_THECC|nr:PREDICTED: pentatricopeptide repeat-containing protein At1g79540 [Theobroma cacao]